MPARRATLVANYWFSWVTRMRRTIDAWVRVRVILHTLAWPQIRHCPTDALHNRTTRLPKLIWKQAASPPLAAAKALVRCMRQKQTSASAQLQIHATSTTTLQYPIVTILYNKPVHFLPKSTSSCTEIWTSITGKELISTILRQPTVAKKDYLSYILV